MNEDTVNFHVQNIYDVFARHAIGIDGFLKLKCVQVQNRGVALADSGDIVAVSADCPESFIDYLTSVTGVTDLTTLRYMVDPDPRRHINSIGVLRSMSKDPKWRWVLSRKFVLVPYIQSAAFYVAAREVGLPVPSRIWKTVVEEGIVDRMNDKTVLHESCEKLDIPVPQHWILSGRELSERLISLLDAGMGALYVRKSQSAGAYGNFMLEKRGAKYVLHNQQSRSFSASGVKRLLDSITRKTDLFVVNRFLKLVSSPSTLFYADDEGVRIISHSAQVLSHVGSFQGFAYPIEDDRIRARLPEIEDYTERLLEPWVKAGFRGYGNVDSMLTAEGDVYIAEMNARQTATMPALKVADALYGPKTTGNPLAPPRACLYSRDKLTLNGPTTFDQVRDRLMDKGLLITGSGDREGVVVTIPPSPLFGLHTVGFMVSAPTMARVRELYSAVMETLSGEEEDLLLAG